MRGCQQRTASSAAKMKNRRWGTKSPADGFQQTCKPGSVRFTQSSSILYMRCRISPCRLRGSDGQPWQPTEAVPPPRIRRCIE